MAESRYLTEENELLHAMLDKRFFSVWKDRTHPLWNETQLELYLTSHCNQACEYCYLHTRGDRLYPQEYDNKETIMQNLHYILGWMYSEKFHLHELQLFSGEIWHKSFGFDVLELILSYIKKGLGINAIMIPTNTTFALKEKTLDKMQDIIDRFTEAGCRLMISHSIEGLILEDISRPMKDGSVRDGDYYDRVFRFAKKNAFYFHPMVAAANIEKWIENYDWFKDMCIKHDIAFPRGVMMLEVRNPDWTDEKLRHLGGYYLHQIKYMLEESSNDLDVFLQKVLGVGNSMDANNGGYSNIAIPLVKTQAACSIPSTLTVRVGDLAVVPCHRTAYPQFTYGYLNFDDEGSYGIEAANTQAAMKILYSNNLTSHHGCDVCAYKGLCMRCCYGEQYEATGEIFMPDGNVCRMFKAKYNFLIDAYREIGLLEHMSSIPPSDMRYIMVQDMLKSVDKINEARRYGDV